MEYGMHHIRISVTRTGRERAHHLQALFRCLLAGRNACSAVTLLLLSAVTVMSWSSQHRRVNRTSAIERETNGNGGHPNLWARERHENGHAPVKQRSAASLYSSLSRFASQPYSALLVISAVAVALLVLLIVRDSYDVETAEQVDAEQLYVQPLFRRRVAPWFRLPSQSSSSCPSSLQPLASVSRTSLAGIAVLTACAAHSSNIAVVSSASEHPTAGMIGLTQLTAHWCVLVMAERDDVSYATFAAGVHHGINSYVSAMRLRGESNIPRADDIDRAQLLARIAYIDHNEQRQLPYRLASLVQSSHTTPKNLGYLLALHAGATTIFDMDDNTLYLPSTSRTGNSGLPIDTHCAHYISAQSFAHSARSQAHIEAVDPSWSSLTARAPSQPPESSMRAVDVTVFNPHPVYGRPDSWPRGFPIDWVHATLPNDPLAFDGLCLPNTTSIAHFCRPVIQHMLSNQQPDVDAIYTTTVAAATSISDFLAPDGQRIRPFAARHAPAVAVPAGTYMPFNSRATVWLSDVFFAMLLPSSLPARVADVWRSYIAETLLSFMESGQFCLAVTPPHVASLSARNSSRHPRGMTADSDLRLFAPTAAVLSWLTERQSGGSMDLQRRVRQVTGGPERYEWSRTLSFAQSEWMDMLMLLYADMFEVGVLGELDITYVQAWLSDVQCIQLHKEAVPTEQVTATAAAYVDPNTRIFPEVSSPSSCFPSYLLASSSTESSAAPFNIPANPSAVLASDGNTYPISAYPHSFLWPDKSPFTQSHLAEAAYYDHTTATAPPPLRPYPPHLTPPKPRVDFVLRTFAGYSTLTSYMLKSLDTFLSWRAVGDVIVVLDESEVDRQYAATLPDDVKVYYEPLPAWFGDWNNTAESGNLGVKRSNNGYNLGVYSSWVADRYSEAEYICVLDPDMLMVTRNALPLMFDWDEQQRLYRPVWICRDFPEKIFVGTSYRKLGLNESTAPGCMQQLPVCVRRDLLRTMRLFMNNKYKTDRKVDEIWQPYSLDPDVDRDSDYEAYKTYYDQRLLAGGENNTHLPAYSLVPPSAFERTYVWMVNEDTFSAVCQFCVWGSYLMLHPTELKRYTLYLQGDKRPDSSCSHIRVGTHAAYLIPPPKISAPYYALADKVIAEGVCRATLASDCNRPWCEQKGWWLDVAGVRSAGAGAELNVSALVSQELLLKWETQDRWASEDHERKCKAYAVASIFQHYEWQQQYDLMSRSIRDKQCRTVE